MSQKASRITVVTYSVSFLMLVSCSKTGSKSGVNALPGQAVAMKQGIVLQDNVRGFDQPFIDQGTTFVTYNTGDIVQIASIRRKEQNGPDDVSYGIVRDRRDYWISGKWIFVPANNWFFNRFEEGTWIPQQNETGESPENTVLGSVEFFQRMAKNPDPKVRMIAFKKLLWFDTTPDGIVQNWQAFFDEKDAQVRADGMKSLYDRIDAMRVNVQKRSDALELIDKVSGRISKEEADTLKDLKEQIKSLIDKDGAGTEPSGGSEER